MVTELPNTKEKNILYSILILMTIMLIAYYVSYCLSMMMMINIIQNYLVYKIMVSLS